jgi:probable rRNA maturation factor
MKRAAAAELKIDVLVESEHWQNAGSAKAIIRRALKQAAATLSAKAAELAIVLTDDAAMRSLNRNWRGVDAATNVLAFPARNAAPRSSTARRTAVRANGRLGTGTQLGNRFSTHQRSQMVSHLGDIVLAYETVEREARRDGKLFDHHLAHLVVHGFLHLLGYDHLTGAQARRMETTERAILRDLAVSDPYRSIGSTDRHAGQRAAKRARGGRARRVENA